MGNVVSLSQLEIELSSRRKMSPRKPPRVVFTNGVFDILHVGHARYLRDARALGDLLVVAVNSDASVKTLGKGDDRPIQHQDDRAELVASLGSVDFAVIFEEPTPEAAIERIVPDVLVKGGDWKPEQILGSKFVLARGGEVRSLPFHPGHSTTKLREDGRALVPVARQLERHFENLLVRASDASCYYRLMNILNLVICTMLLAFSGLSFSAPLRQAHLRGVVTEEGVKPLIFVQALEPEAGAHRGTYYRLAEPQEGVTFGVLPTDLKRGETVEFNGQFLTVQMGEEAAGQFINPMSYSTLDVVGPKPQDALTPECQTRLYEKFKEIEGLVSRSESQEP